LFPTAVERISKLSSLRENKGKGKKVRRVEASECHLGRIRGQMNFAPAQRFEAAIEDESNMIFMQRDGIVKREGQMLYQDFGCMLSAYGGLQALDS
jgi:hypothetical protein